MPDSPVPESGPPTTPVGWKRLLVKASDAIRMGGLSLRRYTAEQDDPQDLAAAPTPVTDEMVPFNHQQLNAGARALVESGGEYTISQARDIAHVILEAALVPSERRVAELEEALRKILGRANRESVIADVARAALGDRSPRALPNDEFREMANTPTHPGNKEYVAANLLALLDALRPHGFDTGDWFGQLWLWAKRSKGDQRPNSDFADRLAALVAGRRNHGRAHDEYEDMEEALTRARVERDQQFDRAEFSEQRVAELEEALRSALGYISADTDRVVGQAWRLCEQIHAALGDRA